MSVLVVHRNKLTQIDMGVNELLCLCQYDIEDLAVHIVGLARKLGLSWVRSSVAHLTVLVVAVFVCTVYPGCGRYTGGGCALLVR